MGTRRGGELGVPVRDRPGPGAAVDRQCGPAVAVLVADVDEERVVVVLDAHAMLRIALLVQ